MNNVINANAGFGAMRPEDQIRALRQMGVNDNAARQTADVLWFTNRFGAGEGPQYAMALGEHLKRRGHNVTYNYNP